VANVALTPNSIASSSGYTERPSIPEILVASLTRLNRACDVHDFLEQVMAEIVNRTGAANAGLTRYDPSSNLLTLELFHTGQTARWGPSGNEIRLWSSGYDADITPAFAFGRIHRRPFVASMYSDQCGIPIKEFALPGGLDWTKSKSVSDMAFCVLMAGDEPVGTLHLHFTGGRTLSPADLPLLEGLSQQAAIVIRMLELSEQAKQAAIAREQEAAAEIRAVEAHRISNFLSATLGRMAEGNDLHAAIDHIVTGLARELGAIHVFLFRHDPTARTLLLDTSYIDGQLRPGPSGEELQLWSSPFPDDITPAWRIMTEQRGLFTPDFAPISPSEFAWPGAFEYAARFELSDVGHIVLFAGDVPVGSIGIGIKGGRKIRPQDKRFIEEVANQAAVAIRMLDLGEDAKRAAVATALMLEREAAARERAAELSKANDAMRQAIESLAIEPDLISFAGRLLIIIGQQFGAPVVEYWTHEGPNVAKLRLTCRSGRVHQGSDMKHDPRIQGIVIPRDMTGAPDLYAPRSHFISHDLPNDPTQQAVFSPLGLDLASWCIERGVRKHLNVPLRSGDRAFGALVIYIPMEEQFTDVRIELAYALAHQMTLAIRLTDLALESQRATIAREREDAATNRAAELAKANKAITDGLRRMATESNLSRMPGMILLEVCKHACADACCWLDYDPDHHTLNLALRSRQGAVSDQAGPDEPSIFRLPFAADITPAFEYLLATDELVELSAPDLQDYVWPGVMQWHNKNGRTSMLACAVKVGDQPVGVLGMGFRRSVDMTRSQRELIRALANHLALAVHLTRLSRKANSAAILDERNRIARDIHDSLAQNFTGILMQLQAANRFSEKNPGIARACVDRAETLARKGLKEARRSVMSLVQEDERYQDIGLALRSLVETATADTGTRAVVNVSGDTRSVHPLTAVNLLRVCQEALGNAQRYAQAKQINIDLTFTPKLVRLTVEDDGIGFVLAEASGGGFGLAGMRQRAERINGALTIDSAPGRGTRIVLEGPLNDPTEVLH